MVGTAEIGKAVVGNSVEIEIETGIDYLLVRIVLIFVTGQLIAGVIVVSSWKFVPTINVFVCQKKAFSVVVLFGSSLKFDIQTISHD